MKVINKFLQEGPELDHGQSVKAIIRHGEYILLLRRTYTCPGGGQWDLPGGGIEEGESKEDALRREVYEETGLKIDNIKFKEQVKLNLPEQGIRSTMNIYTCDSDSIAVNLKPAKWKESGYKPEHDEYKWVENRSDIVNLPMLKILKYPIMEELK